MKFKLKFSPALEFTYHTYTKSNLFWKWERN